MGNQKLLFSGELNNDPHIYHILSSATAGDDFHGYKQVWLTTGGKNPSFPYSGGDNTVPEDQWESFEADLGYEKIVLKNAFFDTSIETFGSSPNQPSGTYIFMKDNQDNTWFYGTIFKQAVIPDGLFPGDDLYQAANNGLNPGQMSLLVNDKNQLESFPALNDDGDKITYYFINDPWGNEYLAQGASSSDVDSSKPGSAEALADLFNKSVLPEGWTKSSRQLTQDFILKVAKGDHSDGIIERKYNAVGDSNDILYYQTAWSSSGKLPAMKISGMPAWNNDEDGVLRGGNMADDLHGAKGKDLLTGGRGDDYLYGNNGRDTLKGGQGDDVISGGKGHDRLYGNAGQNIFLDERDGSKDRIYIVQDENEPDRIMGLDTKDGIVIEPLSGFSDIGLTVEKVELNNVGQALLISIGNSAVAYYTGDDLTKRELLLMTALG